MTVGRESQNAMTWRRRRLPDTHDDGACANRSHMLGDHMARAMRELRMVHRSIDLARHSFLGSPLNLTMPGYNLVQCICIIAVMTSLCHSWSVLREASLRCMTNV